MAAEAASRHQSAQHSSHSMASCYRCSMPHTFARPLPSTPCNHISGHARHTTWPMCTTHVHHTCKNPALHAVTAAFPSNTCTRVPRHAERAGPHTHNSLPEGCTLKCRRAPHAAPTHHRKGHGSRRALKAPHLWHWRMGAQGLRIRPGAVPEDGGPSFASGTGIVGSGSPGSLSCTGWPCTPATG